jgi:hypothetical protein
MIKNWKLFVEKYETDDSDWEMEDDDFIPFDQEPTEEDLDGILDDNDIDLEIENLCSLIRKFLKNSNLDSMVEYKEGEIEIYVFLSKKESIKSMRETMESLKRLQKDILPEYESSVELFMEKESPILYAVLIPDEEEDGDEDENKK